MKICFIAKNLALEDKNAKYGGYRRMAYELITGIKKSLNCEIFISAEKVSGFPEDVKFINGVKLNLQSIFKLRRIVKNFDVIHALDGWPCSVIGWLANLGLGKKFIISTVGTASVKPLHEFPESFLLKKSYKAADKVTAISRFVSGEIKKVIPELQVAVINLGVNSTRFSPQHACKKEIFDKIRTCQPYILSTGDVRERKGYHISIPAFAGVVQKIPELNYVIVGFKQKNDYTEKIKEMIKEKSLEKKVHLLEDISDDYLEELYARAELFVLLPVNIGYDFEGFGLVFLEAAINGLPSITTRGNGSEDAVIDGETGILVAQNSVKEAAEAVEKLLADASLRKTLGANARKFAQKMSWDDVCRRYVDIYQTNKIEESNLEKFNSPEAIELYNISSLTAVEEKIIDRYFSAGGKTLDIGCGTGRTTARLAEKFEVIGIDFAPEMIKKAGSLHPKLDFRIMNAANLAFPDNYFDNIFFSFCGIDYSYPKNNRTRVLKEIYRTLKPGGVFAFSSHNSRFIPNTPGRIKNWLKNFLSFRLLSDYFIDYQVLGKLVTYHAPPSSQIRDLKMAGFDREINVLSKETSKRWLIGFLDPRPYYVATK